MDDRDDYGESDHDKKSQGSPGRSAPELEEIIGRLIEQVNEMQGKEKGSK